VISGMSMLLVSSLISGTSGRIPISLAESTRIVGMDGDGRRDWLGVRRPAWSSLKRRDQ
jgi:hypothetical protein